MRSPVPHRFVLDLLVGLAVIGFAAGAVSARAEDNAPTTVRVTWTETRSGATEPSKDVDEAGRRAIGRLVFSRVSIDADDRPVREVLGALAKALSLNLMPFYASSDPASRVKGIEPSLRITLVLEDVDGRAALEAIAAQCGPAVTWQLHRGLIEFGPRVTLAREDARRTQAYQVTDLGLEAPYFQPSPGLAGRASDRLRPKDVYADLVRSISEQCEPEAFEPAPPPTEAEIAEGSRRPQTPHVAPTGVSPNPRRDVNTTATRNLDPELGPVFVKGQWAQIQVKDSTLVVTAPDFVHRSIDGYPPPIPPAESVRAGSPR